MPAPDEKKKGPRGGWSRPDPRSYSSEDFLLDEQDDEDTVVEPVKAEETPA